MKNCVPRICCNVPEEIILGGSGLMTEGTLRPEGGTQDGSPVGTSPPAQQQQRQDHNNR